MKVLRRLLGGINRYAKERDAQATYRFAVKDWTGINDINIAAQVVGIEGFDKWLEPQPLPLKEFGSILVLAPHQDDEVIGAGGTMLLAADMGAKLTIVFVTDGGAKPHKMLMRSGRYPTPEAFVERRYSEASRVCEALGAEMVKLGVSNARPAPDIETLDRLQSVIEQARPDAILTPWLLDLRPKHRMVNHLLWLVRHRAGLPKCEVWGYQVNNTLFPNCYVDITDVAERKRELVRFYQSQIEYLRRFDHETLGLNAWNGRFVPNRAAAEKEFFLEIFFVLPPDEHLAQVEKYYFPDLTRTYLDEGTLAQKMNALHRRIVAESAAQ